ncbi:MAG: gliding-motility protein MglA [Deltaproteobacteria bacterium]|nr:gliding-motility protein MglA [Deltaproteobacteria bacterium]
MAFVNYSTREINVKIVYCGPGLSGKTTNLQLLHDRAPAKAKGRLISLATETERTLFFDFLPMNVGTLGGFQVRLHLYTVPGQIFYEASRRLILKGADGVAFVADSDPLRLDANAESIRDLERHLREHRLSLASLPAVIQYNKRDLPDAVAVEEIRRALLNGNASLPEFEAVAARGKGVFETLKELARRCLVELKK